MKLKGVKFLYSGENLGRGLEQALLKTGNNYAFQVSAAVIVFLTKWERWGGVGGVIATKIVPSGTLEI